MINSKLSGSFYTPLKLVQYMVNYSLDNTIDKILEPSFGDGRFLNEILKHNISSLTAIELFEDKINAYNKNVKQLEIIHSDFIDYALKSESKFDLIIGNPPYITKKQISHNNWAIQYKMLDFYKLSHSTFQNIWVSFVLASIKLLNKNGKIFFILPFEFLQVQYSEILRNFVEKHFNYIEITTFKNKVFDKIEQDICLVYLTNKENIRPIITYKNYDDINKMNLITENEICRNKPLKKWSNAILNDREISLLKTFSNKFMQIKEFGEISPGIVTGANDFFIITKSSAKEILDEKMTLPIISKGSNAPNVILFKEKDLNEIDKKNIPSRMLNLNGIKENEFPETLKLYLSNDYDKQNKKIRNRYKCKIRKRWFDVPLIKNGDIMFFKRFNLYPKIMVNENNIYSSDIAYNIRLKDLYDAASVVFCFYNSLTLALCEYNGRFYGGGVNELVPSEFKSLYIPYKKIPSKHIKKLDKMFRLNTDIEKIIDYVDSIVFNSTDNSNIQKLKTIRKKYHQRRLKQF